MKAARSKSETRHADRRNRRRRPHRPLLGHRLRPRAAGTCASPIRAPRRSRPRRGLIREALDDLAAAGLVDDPAAAPRRVVSVAPSLAEAVAGADLVQENGPETRRGQARASSPSSTPRRRARRSSPPRPRPSSPRSSPKTCPAASAASSLIPSTRRISCPIVELCGAPWTSPETIARARGLYESVGQAPITVNREIVGFVLNRLQVALLAEAFRLVGEGVVARRIST